MNLAAWLLAVVLAGLGCGAGGYYAGRDQGKASETAKRDAKAVSDLTGLIDSHQALITNANAASRAMRQALASRGKTDQQSTKDLQHGLTTTADSRAGCLFPADSMRQLAEAQQRAAEAAAGGVRRSVPGAAASTGGPGG